MAKHFNNLEGKPVKRRRRNILLNLDPVISASIFCWIRSSTLSDVALDFKS